MTKKTNDKPIYEYDEKECQTALKSVKSDISTLNTELMNNTGKKVFGELLDITFTFKGEKITYSDFIKSDDFDDICNEAFENYGILCQTLWGDGDLNDKALKRMLKNIGIPKNVFWKLVWKKTKILYNESKKEKILKRIEYLKKESEKEKKVGDK